MDDVVDIYIEGEKHKAYILNIFDLEDRTFCIYSIPNGDGSFGIKCGKKIGDQIVDIEDDYEKKVVENITKTVLLGEKKENLLNMENDEMKFKVKDENGVEKDAYIVGKFEVLEKDYIVYAVEENEENMGLYIKRVVYDKNGEEETYETITDPKEKETVYAAVREFINQEVGDI